MSSGCQLEVNFTILDDSHIFCGKYGIIWKVSPLPKVSPPPSKVSPPLQCISNGQESRPDPLFESKPPGLLSRLYSTFEICNIKKKIPLGKKNSIKSWREAWKYSRTSLMWTPEGRPKSVHNSEVSTVVKLTKWTG